MKDKCTYFISNKTYFRSDIFLNEAADRFLLIACIIDDNILIEKILVINYFIK